MRVNELGNTFLYGFHITIYGGTKVAAINIRWKGSSLHKKMSSHFVDSYIPKENGESYLLTHADTEEEVLFHEILMWNQFPFM